MTDDLNTWLRAAMREIEADARFYIEQGAEGPGLEWAQLALADVHAKRRILDRHHPATELENWYWTQRACAECGKLWHRADPDRPPGEIGPEVGCPTVRLLALPYADRPGYRPEWRA